MPYPLGPGRGAIPGIGGPQPQPGTIGDFGGGYLESEILFPGGLTTTRPPPGQRSPYKPRPPVAPPTVAPPLPTVPPTSSPPAPAPPVAPPAAQQPPVEGEVLPPPGPPQHDYEGYYDPETEPPPEYSSGVLIEGEVVPPPGQDVHDRPKPGRAPVETPDDVWVRLGGSALGRIVSRVVGGPFGTVIEEIATPTALPPEPDVRGMPGLPQPISSPAPVMSSTPSPPGYGGSLPSRPERPSLPPVPRVPTVSVPKPDIGVQPWEFDRTLPAPNPPPVSPTAPQMPSSPGTTAPRPATSSQPQPSSPTQPSNSNWPWLLTGLLPSLLSPRSSSTPALSAASPLPTITSPGAFTAPTTTPTTTSSPTSNPFAPTPPLTPINALGVESPPAGDSCETGPQRKQRQRAKREECNDFITIKVRAHKKRICVQEAARILGRKIGRKIGARVGKEVRSALKRHGVKLAKLPKRKRIPRGIEIGGGFGIELPKELRR